MVYVTHPTRVLPWDQPLEWTFVSMGGIPMSASIGMSTWRTYSCDGEFDTFVPPVMRSRIGDVEAEKRRYGRMACRTSSMLPGVDWLLE
jgi:hypothetical protein